MESFLGIDIKDFTQQFIEVCKSKKINYIVTVSNRGNMLLEEIIKHNPDFTKSLDLLGITVYNEKDLVRKSLYGKVSNSNILLFDDLIKTEEHIKIAREKIEKGINSCDETNNQQNTQFSYYAVYRYENSNIEDEQINDNLCIYGTKSAGAYYQFGIDEGIYSQKKLIPTTTELPIIRGTIRSIDDFVDFLKSYCNAYVVIDKFKVGNEKFPLINVFFDEFKFPKDDHGLVLASTIKIRYEKNKENDGYNVLITPFVLTQSMKADALQSLYYDMYGEMIDNVSDHFQMMYGKLVHNFSFYLSNEIMRIFMSQKVRNNFGFNFTYESIDLYSDEYLKSLYLHFINNRSNNNMEYIGNNVTENSGIYRKELFETLIYEPKKKDYAYNYNFCPIENLLSLFKQDKCSVISMLYGYLENYSISNELKYNKDTNTIERGFHIEESSLCYSPVEDRVYYRMLKRFYEKCRKNYNIFKENYFLMHDKAERYFWKDNCSDYISYFDFLYLRKYYYNLTENQLIDEVESKEYKLNDADDELDMLYYFEDNWLSYILDSDDFTFNMNARQRNTFEEEKALLRKKNK